MAHKIAAIASVHAHEDLGLDRSEYIDVFAALHDFGIEALARPMPTLFGVYFSPKDNGPAVLLNASLDIIQQRHTAAHELGHHVMNHGTSADKELDRARQWGNGAWPEEEKVAEAFAAWFLMPRPAVLAALERSGVLRPRSPVDVYRVARWLGTSYTGTARHLRHLRLASPHQVDAWLKVQPHQLRKQLSDHKPRGNGHVHALGPAAHGSTLRAAAGDVLIVGVAGAVPDSVPTTGLELLRGPSATELGRSPSRNEMPAALVTESLSEPTPWTLALPGSPEPFTVTVLLDKPRQGDSRAWQS
ncbi:ImmA/IrrE family metallo-endopeptidase [Kitasatospora sp. NPDC057965]|uniref:ImmA/IrrE family metallo-endopeptidase n=1 Tax=Kitasatospora sp. NPDC057965 TaxID=3346291 RepID=UPI0036DBDA39